MDKRSHVAKSQCPQPCFPPDAQLAERDRLDFLDAL
jgi:hypothetical protein